MRISHALLGTLAFHLVGCSGAYDIVPDAGHEPVDSGIDARPASDGGRMDTGASMDTGVPDSPDAGVAMCYMAFETLPTPALMIASNLLLAPYTAQAAFTQQVDTSLLPQVVTTAGLTVAQVTSPVAPGGYLLATTPSIYAGAAVDDATCNRLSAAFGYVFEQESVLAWTFGEGDVGYGNVAFPTGTLNDTSAQAFFTYASSVNKQLGEGYSVIGDTMVFINLRDNGGTPYSGITDSVWEAAVTQAASSYNGAKVSLAGTGVSSARLIANPWALESTGSQYLAYFVSDPTATAKLEQLRSQFETMAKQAAAQLGD